MLRIGTAPRWWAVVATGLVMALGGCGSAARHDSPRARVHAAAMGGGQVASPGVPSAQVRVIRGWANALRAGHVAAAARYFRLPSVFDDGGGPPIELRSLGQVEVANAALPCGATLLSAHRQGRYINALFRLGNRAGPGGAAGCGSGTGLTARTDFVIQDGRIVDWLRAPDEPGDNGSPQTAPAPAPPSTTPGGGTPLA